MTTRKDDILPLGGSYAQHFRAARRVGQNPIPNITTSSTTPNNNGGGKLISSTGSSLSSLALLSSPTANNNINKSNLPSTILPLEQRTTPNTSKLFLNENNVLNQPTVSFPLATDVETKPTKPDTVILSNNIVNDDNITQNTNNPSSLPEINNNQDNLSLASPTSIPPPELVIPSQEDTNKYSNNHPSSLSREQALEQQVRLLQADYYSLFVKLLESEKRTITNNMNTASIATSPPVPSLSSTTDQPVNEEQPSVRRNPTHNNKRSKSANSTHHHSVPNNNNVDVNFHESTPTIKFAPVYHYPPPQSKVKSPSTKETILPTVEISLPSTTSSPSPNTATIDLNNIAENYRDEQMPLTNSAKRLQQKIIELGDRISHQNITTVPPITLPFEPSLPEIPVPKPVEVVPPVVNAVPSPAPAPVPVPAPVVAPVPVKTPVPAPAPVPAPTPTPAEKHASIFSMISASLSSSKQSSPPSDSVPNTSSDSTSTSTTPITNPYAAENQELMNTIKLLSTRLTEALQLSETVTAERDAIHNTLRNLKKINNHLCIALGIRAAAFKQLYQDEKQLKLDTLESLGKMTKENEFNLRIQKSTAQQLQQKQEENEKQRQRIEQLDTELQTLQLSFTKLQQTQEITLAERNTLRESTQLYKKVNNQQRIAASVRLAATLVERDHARTLAKENKEKEEKATAEAIASLKSQKVAQQQARQAEEKRQQIETLYNENEAKVSYLTTQVDHLKKTIQQNNDEKEILHQTIKQIRQVLTHQSLASGIRLSAIRHQYKELKELYARLQEQYGESLNVVKETKEAAKQARIEMANAINTRDTVIDQMNTLEHKYTNLTKQYQATVDQLNNVTSERDTIHNSMKLVRSTNRQQYLVLSVRTAALMEEKKILQQKLEKTMTSLSNYKKEVTLLSNNQQTLNDTIQALQQENNQLLKDLVAERNQSSTLSTVIASLSKQVEKNTSSATIASAERDALMDTLQHMKRLEHVREEWSLAAHGALSKLRDMEEKKKKTEVNTPSKEVSSSTTETSPSKANTQASPNNTSHGISSWFGGNNNTTSTPANNNNSHEIKELQTKLSTSEKRVHELETKLQDTEKKLKESDKKLQDTEKELQQARTTIKHETNARTQAENERDILHQTLRAQKAAEEAKSNWNMAVSGVVSNIHHNADNASVDTSVTDATTDMGDKKDKKDKKEKKEKKDKKDKKEKNEGDGNTDTSSSTNQVSEIEKLKVSN